MLSSDFRSFLDYDPISGVFTWKTGRRGTARKGSIAGSIDPVTGYRRIRLKDKKIFAHRLAFLWMNGLLPENDIDHINGKRDDNRWCNLRLSNDTINAQNRHKAQSNSRSGLIGAMSNGKKYRARIRVDGKRIDLGSYHTPEEAHAVYVKTKRQLHEGNTL